MRAGVRPGLQILRILLSGIGRFDSDTLPPHPSGRAGWSREESTRRVTRCPPVRALLRMMGCGRGRGSLMSPRKPRTIKPFSAAKEVKRQARAKIGAPPPTKLHETRKRKPPKHKKLAWELGAESGEI